MMFKQILSAEDFHAIIGQNEPVVIKFEADWCPDCKRMDMFIEDVMSQFNEISSYSIDKDQFEDIASQQDVMGIPSLLVFQNNQKLGHLHSANAKTPHEVSAFLQTFFS